MRIPVAALVLSLSIAPAYAGAPRTSIALEKLGTYASGSFAVGAAEIVAYDALTRRTFVINAAATTVDVLDVSRPAQPRKVGSIDASALGGSANSVDVQLGLVAVAIEAQNKQDNGVVAFFRSWDLKFLGSVPVGALPDMLTFSPDGRYVLVANEGEPNDDYSVDPPGSVSIIDLHKGVARATVRHATFDAYNSRADELRGKGIRIFGPGSSVAQDLEPEYVTIDGNRAYVTLQEANALGVIDIARAKVIDILPLGYKNHLLPGKGLDPSDRDGGIAVANWPVRGLYEPDGIASYQYRGKTYLVTANEGDTRAYSALNEEVRVGAGAVRLDPVKFPNATALKNNAALGRLTITNTLGDEDGDGDFDALYVPGGRSFSIWSTDGRQVFDSGDEFESIVGNLLPAAFNSNHEEQPSFDTRSDNKGPEPEGVALGEVLGRTYAFVGLERVGGLMVYDVTDPKDPFFVQYFNDRNFEVPVTLTNEAGETVANPAAGDLGPEGVSFVPWYLSPNLRPLLLVGNEISGSTTIYQVNVVPRPR